MAKRENESMQATLRFEDGKSAQGVLVNLTGRGFVLVIDSLRNANEALGARVTLEASGEGIEGEQAAPGHIQGLRSEDSGHHRVSVWLDDADDLDRMVDAGVGASFNRRGAYRVTPSIHAPVNLTLTTLDDAWSYKGKASDLSASGVGIVVDASTARRIEEAFELRLTLSMPQTSAPITMISHVRRVIPKASGQLVGFDFDPTNTADFDALIEDVITYVMRRQREELREKRAE